MTNSFHSFVFLLVMTMLLCSACRSARSMAKEESATQTSDTCRTSVASESSFAAIFRELSLRADSIVLWFQDSETVLAPASEDSCCAPEDTVYTLPEVCCTAHRPSNAKPGAQPSLRERSPSKVLIAGLQLKSQSAEEKQSTSLARDSLSARESHDSSLSESQESKPPNSIWSLMIAGILGAAIVVFAVFGILRAMKIK